MAALKKGTWVKVTGRETVGKIVGYRPGDMGLPEAERSYEIYVEEETLYFPPSHFEVLPDTPKPDRVALAERWEKVAEACRNYMAAPGPNNTQALIKALSNVGMLKPK